MTFIPTAHFVPHPPPPSPRAQELGRRLAEVVDAFRAEHPDLEGEEVRQALQLARGWGGAGARTMLPIVAALLAVLVALGLLLFRSGADGGTPILFPAAMMLVVLMVVVMLVLRRR